MGVLNRSEELALLDPSYYQRHGYPYSLWETLRREDPIHYVERDNNESFWAVTRYEDIVNIQSNPDVFKNAPRLVFGGTPDDSSVRIIVSMDPPEHKVYRNLVNKRFLPKSIEWVRRLAEEIVTETLDSAMERNGEVVDMQAVLANPVPTSVICSFLGASRELWPKLVAWTDCIINSSDPEIAKEESSHAVVMSAVQEMFGIYAEIFEDRRKAPQDDLLTDLINARIDGKSMPEREMYSWCFILTTAGHETTQNTFSMGIHSLIQNPGQFDKLRKNPDLLPRAIEEFLRYVSPAIHFCRTPDRDIELHGKRVRAGEPMVMFYPSANRDGAVFEHPDALDIGRNPNRHIAFGVGPHICLGMNFARLELKIMFEQFFRRVKSIEVAETPKRVHSCITGGYRSFPVRMQVDP